MRLYTEENTVTSFVNSSWLPMTCENTTIIWNKLERTSK